MGGFSHFVVGKLRKSLRKYKVNVSTHKNLPDPNQFRPKMTQTNFQFRWWLNTQDVGVAAIEKIWEAQDLSLFMTSYDVNFHMLRNNIT